MADGRPLDRNLALSLLEGRMPFGDEEYLHPWAGNSVPAFRQPLLRVWDEISVSQPTTADICLLAGEPRQRLDGREIRREALANHAIQASRVPTPFISFTTSKTAAKNLAFLRSKTRRQDQWLTVVNPNFRLHRGLPILDMGAEMAYYGVENPYGTGNYYEDHYLCLWEVSKPEVVGHWRWDWLVGNRNWYKNIILRAFEKHNEPTGSDVCFRAFHGLD
jgi:hypothetical protein